MVLGNIAYDTIEKNRAHLWDLAKRIWDNPEGPNREFNACKWSAEMLEGAGFAVEVGTGGLSTAIKATYRSGCGSPVIAFLGEYDALQGLSQRNVTWQSPVTEGGWGHGCGHNLLGVGHIGAVIGLAGEMKAGNIPGAIIYYGCPAEEILTGKVFMARAGAFDGVDISIHWHPGSTNKVSTGCNIGLNNFKLHFKGRTAHAGGDPYNGRSALDAIELTNVGIQYLREHVTSDVRMHYVITDGGLAPNIVPDRASAWYFVRAETRERIEEVYNRLLNIARGAAMMTETEMSVEFLGGCYPTRNNKVLVNVVHEAMSEAPQDAWSADDIEFAKAMSQSPGSHLAEAQKHLGLGENVYLHTGACGVESDIGHGSTDVGDIGHIMPTVMFSTACAGLGSPGHSWQITSCAGGAIGEKGMIYAARIMALFGLKVFANPNILAEAKSEFDKVSAGHPYVCPIPDDVLPPQ